MKIIFQFSFFFYLGFLSRTFTNHRTAGEGGGHLFNSSLLLPPASQALRHWPGDYCGELTSAHSQPPDSSREPLVSERKSVTTKLRTLKSVNMSVFSLKILVGTSVPCQALEASKQTSWKVSFFSTCEELDKSFDFATLSIAFILLG